MRTLIALAAVAGSAVAAPAYATVYDATFTGIVTSSAGAAGRQPGATVSGSFVLTDTGTFLSFMVDGQSPATGYASSAAYSAGQADAIYRAQVSPVPAGSGPNSTFALDLSSLSTWPVATESAPALLADAAQLASNLDLVTNPLSLFPSTFGYNVEASNTVVSQLTANLPSLSVTPGPEPATLALLGGSLLGLAASRRRA